MKGQNKSNMSSFQFAEKKSDMKILLHKETEFKITLLTSISDISTYHLNTYVRKVQIIVRAIRRVFRADGTGRGVGAQCFQMVVKVAVQSKLQLKI